MYQQDGIRSYRKTNVITSDPGRLVIMCYEGAMDQLEIAKRKYAESNFEGKAKSIQKAGDIIDELLCSLDFEKGGIIAQNLESLYNYMTRRILQAEAERSTEMLDEVIGMLGELKSAWEVAVTKQSKPTQLETVRSEPTPEQNAMGRISI